MALGVVALVVMVFVLLPPALAAVAALLDLEWGDLVVVGAVGAPLLGVGPLAAIGPSGAHRTAMTAWGRGDTSDPASAWAAAVHAPPAWTERATLANLVALGVVLVPVLAIRVDLTPIEIGVVCVAVFAYSVAGGLLIGTGYQLLLRPMLDEVTPYLDLVGMDPAPGRWSLRGRFFVAIASTCFLTGVLAAAAVSLADTRESVLVVAVGVSAAAAGYMLLFFGGFLVMPTLRPLTDLTAATTRVSRGDFDVPVPVTTADEFGRLSAAFNDMQRGLRERAALNAAFGSYVDPALAQRLLAQGSAIFEGEDLVVTVMFTDVRDFTSYSERVAPADAVALLNRLFDVIVPVLHEHAGHANHYLGDGLLAVFGAPQPLAQHADAAVLAATEIQRRVRAEFGVELRLGIGINTGPVIAGTVGGGGRHEFTVIGDTVNAAARVEALTKETGDSILITDATRLALSAPRPRSTKRGEFELRGKSAKMTLHAINPFPRPPRSTR